MMPSTIAQNNRRSGLRRPSKGSTKVKCLKGSLGLGPNLGVSVLDLSETGVRMIVKAVLKQGEEIEVTLSGMGQSQPFKAAAEVIWSVPTADGNYCLGARFHKCLSYGDLLQLSR